MRGRYFDAVESGDTKQVKEFWADVDGMADLLRQSRGWLTMLWNDIPQAHNLCMRIDLMLLGRRKNGTR